MWFDCEHMYDDRTEASIGDFRRHKIPLLIELSCLVSLRRLGQRSYAGTPTIINHIGQPQCSCSSRRAMFRMARQKTLTCFLPEELHRDLWILFIYVLMFTTMSIVLKPYHGIPRGHSGLS